jgi:C4-dicarboxylate transporter DctM subunit
MTFALFVVPIVLLLSGFPIFMVLLTAVTVALVFFMHVPLVVVHQNLFGSINATPLLAVPFFIYAGELMGRGSVAQRLVDFVQAPPPSPPSARSWCRRCGGPATRRRSPRG